MCRIRKLTFLAHPVYTEDRPTGDRPTTDDLTFGKKFIWPYFREGSSDPLHVWFYGWVFEVGGSNGAISGFGGSAATLENSNCDISAADHPIYSVFGSRMEFSGSADRMAVFPAGPD